MHVYTYTLYMYLERCQLQVFHRKTVGRAAAFLVENEIRKKDECVEELKKKKKRVSETLSLAHSHDLRHA